MNMEGTLSAAVCLLLDAPERDNPSGYAMEITMTSS